MKTEFGDREYWGKHLDMCIETIKNDREKLLDIIMDKCQSIDITIPIRVGEVPLYKVEFFKTAYISYDNDKINKIK